MNILFYTEPHALRDSFTSHSHPYKVFLNICRQIKHAANAQDFDNIDVRVFSNHVLQQIRFTETIDVWPLILTPTSEEQKNIEELATMWLPHGVQDWIDLCSNSNSNITKFYKKVLERIKSEEYNFDVIVCWGQNQAVKNFAAEHNVQTIYFELASMRPPFPMALLMDPVGVNGAASSTHLHIDDIKKTIKSTTSELLFTALNDEFHPTRQSSNLFISKFQPTPWPSFNNEAPIALVPLQLADDANLLLYSDFSSIDSFTDTVVRKLTAHGWNIILKPHPHAYLRGGYVERAQRDTLKKYETVENVRVLSEIIDNAKYLSLLSAVDLIVTNNSSVGFEGILCGTPCITMGTACYSIKGGLPSLDEFLDASPAEREVYSKNASVIAAFMTSFMFPLERKIAHELVSRIKLWSKLTPPPLGNSVKWIRDNVEALGWSTWHEGNRMQNHMLKHEKSSSESQRALENA